MKKLLTLLFAVALTLSLSSVSFAQGDAPKKDDTKKADKADKKKKKKEKKEKTEKKDEKKSDMK